MKKIGLYLMLAAVTATPSAYALNKCATADGKTIYTDGPCPDSAKKTEIKTAPASAAMPAASSPSVDKSTDNSDAKKVDVLAAARKQRDIKYELEDIDHEIATLRKQMDRDLAALQAQKARSNNNLAGATRDQSISAEMQTVATSYETKIKIAQDKASALRAELHAKTK